MVVRGKSNFPELAVKSNTLDFGVCAVGYLYQESVTLINRGKVPLVFSITPPRETSFLMQKTTSTLAPKQEMDVKVGFSPVAVGRFASSLIIECRGINYKEVILSGIGALMKLDVIPDVIDLGKCSYELKMSNVLTLRNAGDVTINASFSAAQDDPSCDFLCPDPVDVRPKETVRCPYAITVNTIGAFETSLSIQTREKKYTVPISGVGIKIVLSKLSRKILENEILDILSAIDPIEGWKITEFCEHTSISRKFSRKFNTDLNICSMFADFISVVRKNQPEYQNQDKEIKLKHRKKSSIVEMATDDDVANALRQLAEERKMLQIFSAANLERSAPKSAPVHHTELSRRLSLMTSQLDQESVNESRKASVLFEQGHLNSASLLSLRRSSSYVADVKESTTPLTPMGQVSSSSRSLIDFPQLLKPADGNETELKMPLDVENTRLTDIFIQPSARDSIETDETAGPDNNFQASSANPSGSTHNLTAQTSDDTNDEFLGSHENLALRRNSYPQYEDSYQPEPDSSGISTEKDLPYRDDVENASKNNPHKNHLSAGGQFNEKTTDASNSTNDLDIHISTIDEAGINKIQTSPSSELLSTAASNDSTSENIDDKVDAESRKVVPEFSADITADSSTQGLCSDGNAISTGQEMEIEFKKNPSQEGDTVSAGLPEESENTENQEISQGVEAQEMRVPQENPIIFENLLSHATDASLGSQSLQFAQKDISILDSQAEGDSTANNQASSNNDEQEALNYTPGNGNGVIEIASDLYVENSETPETANNDENMELRGSQNFPESPRTSISLDGSSGFFAESNIANVESNASITQGNESPPAYRQQLRSEGAQNDQTLPHSAAIEPVKHVDEGESDDSPSPHFEPEISPKSSPPEAQSKRGIDTVPADQSLFELQDNLASSSQGLFTTESTNSGVFSRSVLSNSSKIASADRISNASAAALPESVNSEILLEASLYKNDVNGEIEEPSNILTQEEAEIENLEIFYQLQDARVSVIISESCSQPSYTPVEEETGVSIPGTNKGTPNNEPQGPKVFTRETIVAALKETALDESIILKRGIESEYLQEASDYFYNSVL